MELTKSNRSGGWSLAAVVACFMAVEGAVWSGETPVVAPGDVEAEAMATPAAAPENGLVGPMKPVLVVNTPDRPVPVAEAAREPFNKIEDLNILNNSRLGSADIVTVPEGKQLVVTHASIEMPAGSPMSFSVIAIGPGFAVASHPLLPVASGPLGAGGPPSIVASQPLNMILPEGVLLTCRANRDGTTGEALGFCCISGYMVDAPAPATSVRVEQ